MADETPPSDTNLIPKQTQRRGPGRRRPNAKDDVKRLEMADRRAEVVRLRASGLGYRQIAAKLGINLQVAHKDFQEGIKSRPAEAVDELRATADETLRAVLEGHVEAAREGNDKSAQVVIKAIATHAKIFGYEAPQKVEMTGKDGGPLRIRDVTKLTDAELEAVIRGEPVGGSEGESGAGEAPPAEGPSEAR